jgi:hypothetical protein
MNRAQFNSFLNTPALLPAESATQLAEVIREFPYFQSAHLLYAKSLHLQNSIHYNNQLKIAAAYATDRKVLFQLIRQTEKTAVANKQGEQAVSRDDEQLVAELKMPVVKEQVPESTPLLTPDPVAPQQVPTKPPLTAQEILDARLAELAQKTPPQTAALPVEPLLEEKPVVFPEDKPVVLAPVVRTEKTLPPPRLASLSHAEDIPSEPVDTDDTRKTEQDLNTLTGTYISTAIDAAIQIEIKNDELEISPEADPAAADTELSFSDWLKKSKASANKKEADRGLEPVPEVKKHKETELIEKFIKEEPRIQKPHKEFYSPVNMARQSVVEDPDFVTETLAGIYAKQGNSGKAIQAYQTLSLKYPEKKLYFASLIEKLENKV